MKRGLAAALILAVVAGQAGAEEIGVRSGEHADFSRLVLEPESETGWTLGRMGQGYELRLDRPGVTFDLSGIFELIPRTRIAAITPGSAEGSIAIGLNCNCAVNAFETAAGVIVIDVSYDAPDPASPFEARLDAGDAVAAARPEPALDDPAGRLAGPTALGGFALLRRMTEIPPQVPYLDAFWDPPEDPTESPAETPPQTAQVAPGISDAPVAPVPPEIGGEDRMPIADAGRPDLPSEAPARPQEMPVTSVPGRQPEAGGQEAPAQAMDTGESRLAQIAASNPVRPPAGGMTAPTGTGDVPPSRPTGSEGLPDPRVLIAERDLLVQLSRAASQGLVVPGRPGSAVTARPAEGVTQVPGFATPSPSDPSGAASTAAGNPAAERLALHAETSIDRVIVGRDTAAPMTGEGSACPASDDIDVASWGTPGPAAAQIADLRRPLVGEFDRPDPSAAVALARLYLYLGFGAEAMAALDAFGVADADAPFLRGLAGIMDDTPATPDGPFAALTDCPGGAALWSVLSHATLPKSTPVDYGAVVRGFSALPVHLRQHLGPRLARLFIGQGKPDVARSIRNALARAEVDHGETLEVIDADLALSRGNRSEAETLLDGVVSRGSAEAPAALRDAIRSRLDDGRPVEPRIAEAALAFGFELGSTPLGQELQQLAVLALASGGAFAAAFDELERLQTPEGPDTLTETRATLAGMLIDAGDDAAFLDLAFRHRAFAAAIAGDRGLSTRAAGRYLAAGLPGEAERLLAGLDPQDEDVRRLRAKAALADDRPSDVHGLLDGLEDAGSQALRAEAEARQGRHRLASALFGTLGDTARSGSEAWRAGDLAAAAERGPDPVKAALAILGTGTAASPGPARAAVGGAFHDNAPDDVKTQPAPPGDAPLERGRTMISESAAARQAIADLLAALGPSVDPSPTPSAEGAARSGPGTP